MFTLLVNRFSISFHGEAFSSRTFTILPLVRTLWIALKVCFEGFIETSTASNVEFQKKTARDWRMWKLPACNWQIEGHHLQFFVDSLLTPISENFRQIIWHFDLTGVRRLILNWGSQYHRRWFTASNGDRVDGNHRMFTRSRDWFWLKRFECFGTCKLDENQNS